MKTLKFAVAAGILAFAMIAYAGVGPSNQTPVNKIVKISFVQAIEDPGLLEAMIVQLDVSMLWNDVPVYIGRVIYLETYYWIYGSVDEWEWFFHTYR